MSSNNSWNLTPPGVCSPAQPNSYAAHKPPSQRQFDCDEERSPRTPEKNKQIGRIYEWDNGEQLGPNISCHLTIGGETTIHKLVDGKELFCPAPPGEYKVELLENFDENKLNTARQELKDALDAIIEHERAEAAALQKIEDEQSAFSNFLDLVGNGFSGFFLSGVGLIKDAKAWSDLINPFNHFANAAVSAWNAKSSSGRPWVESFANNYSEAQKNDLVKALGFDPSKIKPEDLAQAFEIACFIYEDAPSQTLLKNFASTYVKVQHRREWAEVAGAAVFEIVLAALLIVFTGGVGLAARAAASISTKLLGLLKKLGEILKKLGAWLRSYRIKSNGTVQGISGKGADPVIIPRPAAITPVEIPPSQPLSSAHAPYNPRQSRDDFEATYGADNVTSTTIPPRNAKNARLAGQSHPKTGIVYDNRGFPIFDDIAKFYTKVSPTASYTQQMSLATKDLKSAIQRGDINKTQFTTQQLNDINSGSRTISDHSWHHHQDSGRMQLIDKVTHDRTGHIGGDAMKNGK